jgi:hypothetical protein
MRGEVLLDLCVSLQGISATLQYHSTGTENFHDLGYNWLVSKPKL